MKCFYHSADFDGKCSAALIKQRWPSIELIGIDYGDPFPWDSLEPDEEVYMVDFTIQPYEEMQRLARQCSLIWIDHHKTAIEWAEKADFNPPGLREIGRAGCELVWKHVYCDCLCTERLAPLAVTLLGRYDVWDHQDPRVPPFQYGMRLYAKPPEDTAWWGELLLGDHLLRRILTDGEICQRYSEQSQAGVCKLAGFDLSWEGLRWTAINGPYRGSGVHKSRYNPEKHDGMLSFYWTGTQWMFSLSTDKPEVDVSAIAKAHGGGGHRGAAGFQAASIPFNL